MYVVLSRITSINELYLIVKYNKAVLKANESAKREYERLRTESCFKSQTQNKATESAITISLLNTRSFKTSFRGILLEKHLLDNDIMFDWNTTWNKGRHLRDGSGFRKTVYNTF